jgi:hypothetical protein
MSNGDDFPQYGDLERCVDVRTYVEGGAYIKGMWGRLPHVDVRCLSSKEQAEDRKDTEEMHTVSQVQAPCRRLRKRSEDGPMKKTVMVLYSQKDRAVFSAPRIQA